MGKDFLGRVTDLLILSNPTLAISDLVASTTVNVLHELFQQRISLTSEQEDDIRERARRASQRLMEASEILAELRAEVDQRNDELQRLLDNIGETRAQAENWQSVASIYEGISNEVAEDLEARLQRQVRAVVERNGTRRLVTSIVIWTVTVLLGAVLGAVVQQWFTARGINLF